MGPAAAAEAGSMERTCTIRDCECCWLRNPEIPHISPWKDHVSILVDDKRPAWSLLVGVTDGASSFIRVSRLRVARSGRILGRSDDKLEVFHDIVLAKPPGICFHAGAALAPDGRSLCVLRKDDKDDEQPQALQLQLDKDPKEELPLAEIEGSTRPCTPISAAGHIWSLSAAVRIEEFIVVPRRLVDRGRRWEQVGDPFTSPFIRRSFPLWGGGFLQGYAVLPGDKLILVSFQRYGLFLALATDTGCWTPVRTDATRSEEYLPLKGRAIYMKQHDAVYMLWKNNIYAYKLTRHRQDDHDQQLQLSLDPPIHVGIVCPFSPKRGYGFLTRLADGLLCSVWISLAMYSQCPCDHLHAIVTTFRLRGLEDQGGIHVLHSTYRRVDMVPNPDHQEFCFLQEYADNGYSALLHNEEQKHVKKQSKMLPCCSFSILSLSFTPKCFKCGGDGHIGPECTEERERTIFPFGLSLPSLSLPVDPP